MQDQAIGYDSSDTPHERWSVWAFAFAGFGLLGTVAAIALLANGRSHAAESIATVSFFVLFAQESLVSLFDRQGASDNRRSALSQGIGLGALAALLFLGICYWLSTRQLADDAPAVFSRSGLSAAFWIVMSIIPSVSRAYCILRTSLPARRN